MKILFLHHNPLPAPDAASTRIEFLSDFFIRKGNKVTILGAFSYRTIDRAGFLNSRGSRIYNIAPVLGWRDIFSLGFNIISSSVASFFFIVFFRPDIVIISLPNGGYGFGSFWIAKILGRKIVIDYRDEWEDYHIASARTRVGKRVYKLLKNLMTICYTRCDILIAVTEYLVANLEARGLRNISLIPNGADRSIFRPKDRSECRRKIGIAEDDFILIFSGGIGGYYRLDIVLHALKEFNDNYQEKSRLLMVGHGEGLHTILKLAEDLGLKETIIYLGKTLDKHQIVDALCASDIGIVPYDSNPLWRNSLPAKSLEYLACGLPIIATVYSDSILGKMIAENELGATAEPGDVHALCECIRAIRSNMFLAKNLAVKGPDFIKQNFDRNELAEKFYNLILSSPNDQKPTSVE